MCAQQLIRSRGDFATSARVGRVTATIDAATIKTMQRDNAVITMLNVTLHQYESTRTRCAFVKLNSCENQVDEIFD
jgi:hypothetical protein